MSVNQRLPRRFPTGCYVAILITTIVFCLFAWTCIWIFYTLQTERSTAIMRELGIGVEQYQQEHKGLLPALNNRNLLEKQLSPYGSEISLASLHPMLVRPDTDIPYLTNPALADKNLSSINPSSRLVVFYEARPTLGKRVVAVLHAGWIRALIVDNQEWGKLKKESGIP